jgi:TetR/AcrR family transcriptional regulator
MSKRPSTTRNTSNSTANTERAPDQILDSAVKVFSEKGYGAASIREIAGRAGVNHAMIKYYFGNKEELWRAAVNFLLERQLRELDLNRIFAEGTSDGPAATRQLCEQLVRYYARHPEHARMIVQATMQPGPPLEWVLQQTRQHHAVFEQMFGKVTKNNENHDDTIAMLYILVGACQTIFLLQHEVAGMYGTDVSDPAFVDRFVALVCNIFAPDRSAGAEATKVVNDGPTLHTKRTKDGLELRILVPYP